MIFLVSIGEIRPMIHRSSLLLFAICILVSTQSWAEVLKSPEQAPITAGEGAEISGTEKKSKASLKMLAAIRELKKTITTRVKEKQTLLKRSGSETEKENLKAEITKLDKQLNDASVDFERIATGVDVELFNKKKAETFNWEKEVVSLIEPGIKELKRFTAKARHKAGLKDELAYYNELFPVVQEAVGNISNLISKAENKELINSLKAILPEWISVEKQIRNRLEITRMRLGEMKLEEKSLVESSSRAIKDFFRTRGLFLAIALVTCLGVIFLLKLFYTIVLKHIPGYNSRYRPFHVRVLSLIFRIFSLLISTFVLVMVFYLVEDWVLLSLTIIIILGVGWTAKNTLPQFYHQSRLMLNVGSVREGERLIYKGVPWLVKNINVFTELVNPSLDIRLRVPIEYIMGNTSRKFHPKEPWFPCRRNDWVILSDGTRGAVTSLSHEMVELVQRGGARKFYQTPDFLSLSPVNLSINFRLKTAFGISYDLQGEATNKVLETLEKYLLEQIEKEGYKKSLVNLRVEFAAAGASSLDLIVISDFDGEMAPLYNRLTRAVQRWCVDACTLNNWEIPYPQLTIHKPA